MFSKLAPNSIKAMF
ncbi:hypothetical protein [Escherichia coli]|nr:hypothetical protein [Escherichia coli]